MSVQLDRIGRSKFGGHGGTVYIDTEIEVGSARSRNIRKKEKLLSV